MKKVVKQMKIILSKDVPNLGKTGEIIEVKPGYARNFLIPQNLAVLPSSREGQTLRVASSTRKKEIVLVQEEKEKQIQALIGQTLNFSIKVNKQGKPYRAIQAKDIAEKLEIAANLVKTAPLKTVGKHKVKIQSGQKEVELLVDIKAEK